MHVAARSVGADEAKQAWVHQVNLRPQTVNQVFTGQHFGGDAVRRCSRDLPPGRDVHAKALRVHFHPPLAAGDYLAAHGVCDVGSRRGDFDAARLSMGMLRYPERQHAILEIGLDATRVEFAAQRERAAELRHADLGP